MNENEIREIVSMTLDDLLDRELIKKDDVINYQFMSAKLKEYYRTGKKNKIITAALEKIKDDIYFRIIPEYYQQGHTLIWIAVDAGCDRVTVARNKKRLVLQLYDLCFAK